MLAKIITRTSEFDYNDILTASRNDGKIFNWGDILSKMKEPFSTIAFDKTGETGLRIYLSEYLKIANENIITD